MCLMLCNGFIILSEWTFNIFSVLTSNTVNIGSYNPHNNKSSSASSVIFKSEGVLRPKHLRTAEPEFI